MTPHDSYLSSRPTIPTTGIVRLKPHTGVALTNLGWHSLSGISFNVAPDADSSACNDWASGGCAGPSGHMENGGCSGANTDHDMWRTRCVSTCGYCGDPRYNGRGTSGQIALPLAGNWRIYDTLGSYARPTYAILEGREANTCLLEGA